MKPDTVCLLMEPKEKHSYWADRILHGIQTGIKEAGSLLCASTDLSSFPDLSSRPVLVAGSGTDWLLGTVSLLLKQGAHPVIVNACMLPFRGLRCSGVVFELEEILQSCLEGLLAKGKTRCALLGVRQDTAADAAKVSAFRRYAPFFEQSDVIFAQSDLESCVEAFATNLSEQGYDAVLCANDTVAIRLIHHLDQQSFDRKGLDIIGIGNSYVGAGIGLSSIEFDYFEMGRAAVGLHQTLSQHQTDCHMIVSLPCRMVWRESAVLPHIPPALPRHTPSGEKADYFHHSQVENLIRIESMFQSGDETDRALLYGYAKGESSDTIAENLFFSGRAVRYRLTKLMKKHGFESRAAMKEALKQAFSSKNTEDHHDSF